MRTFGTWCDQATRGLFPGKRRVTWKELYHHMAEKRDRYVKMGFEYTAAENKVYEDMGDPKEVAKLLRTVHQSWLDWSLCLTRCLIILLVVWFFKSSGFSLSNLDEKIWSASPVLMPDDEYGIFISRKATWTDNELRIGPSRISIDSVTLWRAWVYDESNGFYHYRLGENAVILRCVAAPWYQANFERLHIVDQTGREYSIDNLWRYRSLPWEEKIKIDIMEHNRVFIIDSIDSIEYLDFYVDTPSDVLRLYLESESRVANLFPMTMADLHGKLDSGAHTEQRITVQPEHAKLGNVDLQIDRVKRDEYGNVYCYLDIQGDYKPEEKPAYRISVYPQSTMQEALDIWVTPSFCSDGIVYEIEWKECSEVSDYVLKYTDRNGESCELKFRIE